MVKKTSYQKCYNLSLYYLAKRQHSILEIETKLKDKEHKPEDIKKTVTKLIKLDFLNDLVFATSRIRYRYETSRWGKVRIKIELKQKGVDEELITQSFATNYENGTLNDEAIKQQAFDLIWRRYEHKVDLENNRMISKDYAKIASFLARRGYSMDQIKYSLDLFTIKKKTPIK